MTNSAVDVMVVGLAALVGATASWTLGRVGSLLHASTTPDLALPWFTNRYGAMLTVGLLLVAVFISLAVVQCLLSGAGAELGRIVVLYLPASVVLMFLAPTLTDLLLRMLDAFTTIVTGNSVAAVDQFVGLITQKLGQVTAAATAGASPSPTAAAMSQVGVGAWAALLILIGSVVVWIELALRDAAVYVVELFVPLGLAALVWPAARHWCRRTIEVLVAIAAAKFFIVAILAESAAGLADTNWSDAFSALAACIAMLVLAAFTPVAILKLIPIAGAELSTALHMRGGLRQAASTVGVTQAMTSAQLALQQNLRGAAHAAMSGAGGATAAGAAGAGGGGGGAAAARNARAEAARRGSPPSPPRGPGGPGGTGGTGGGFGGRGGRP